METQYHSSVQLDTSEVYKIKERVLVTSFIGITNSGKSTLINMLLGRKISIVTPKKQTTRENIKGIINIGSCQLIFTDTPGIFEYNMKNSLEVYMLENTTKAIQKSHCIAFVISIREILDRMKDGNMAELIKRCNEIKIDKKVLIFTMCDIMEYHKSNNIQKFNNIQKNINTLLEKLDNVISHFYTSTIDNGYSSAINEMLIFFTSQAIERQWFYGKGIDTNISKEKFCQEITREKMYEFLKYELPYETKVDTELFEENEEKNTLKIYQVIHVKKQSQQRILIGTAGENIKQINIAARNEMEKILMQKVHLFLHVKTSKHWIKNMNKAKTRSSAKKYTKLDINQFKLK